MKNKKGERRRVSPKSMAQIFEVIMLICFGISWPISVIKSIKSRSAKGKSLVFTIAIIIGYCAGIASKIISGITNYVLWLYIFNLAVVTADLIISIINKRRDEVLAAKSNEVSAKAETDETNKIVSKTTTKVA